MRLFQAALAATLAATLGGPVLAQDKPIEILNVSYDIARELYVDVNAAFAPAFKEKTGKAIEVKQSHGGSSRQARAIMEGLQADVVTFNQVTDIQALEQKGFVLPDWQKRFAYNASPYYSLPAFLVRTGNPKNIRNWDDLVRSDVKVVFPNPKTSGNARYTYLAAYAFALEANKGDHAKAKDFVKKLLANVPVFDTGGRGATTTFVERGIGDVLITFEAETNGIRKEYGEAKVETVLPPVSLLAEFPIAIVDRVVDKRGTREAAKAYLDFLYSPAGQEVLAKHFNRVRDPGVAKKHEALFKPVRLVTIEDVFGSWQEIQKVHFGEGGTLDQVFVAK